MTFNEIKANIYRGDYRSAQTSHLTCKLLPKDHITDVDKSVRWNQEVVEELNKVLRKEIEAIHQENSKRTAQFNEDLLSAIKSEFNFSDKQCVLIKEHVLETSEAFSYVSIEFIEDVENTCQWLVEFNN